jgi:sugar/nucleoside kinase (ribokinase family)
MSLLVVGSLALDTIETPFGRVENAVGGSAVFISIAASYFIQPLRLVGIIGGDFPKSELDFLKEKDIDLEGLQIKEDEKTFHWHGRYSFDLNSRDSITTELNAFASFDPVVPDSFKKSSYVCLGNINPILQKKVLFQVEKPRLIVADTMNFWISNMLNELIDMMKYIDVFIINDSEAREISKEANLIKAAKRIQELGPKTLIIKKGEHGALLFANNEMFFAPAYPLESIYDPTGAGDSFAGGFTGYLARTEDLSYENMKRAVIYGSTIASFAVEKFSIERIRDLSMLEIKDRFNEFKRISEFSSS